MADDTDPPPRDPPPSDDQTLDEDEKLDEAIDDSFPASDPPALSGARAGTPKRPPAPPNKR